jgi:hypothetical protein
MFKGVCHNWLKMCVGYTNWETARGWPQGVAMGIFSEHMGEMKKK